jgi:hypothetical protein
MARMGAVPATEGCLLGGLAGQSGRSRWWVAVCAPLRCCLRRLATGLPVQHAHSWRQSHPIAAFRCTGMCQLFAPWVLCAIWLYCPLVCIVVRKMSKNKTFLTGQKRARRRGRSPLATRENGRSCSDRAPPGLERLAVAIAQHHAFGCRLRGGERPASAQPLPPASSAHASSAAPSSTAVHHLIARHFSASRTQPASGKFMHARRPTIERNASSQGLCTRVPMCLCRWPPPDADRRPAVELAGDELGGVWA